KIEDQKNIGDRRDERNDQHLKVAEIELPNIVLRQITKEVRRTRLGLDAGATGRCNLVRCYAFSTAEGKCTESGKEKKVLGDIYVIADLEVVAFVQLLQLVPDDIVSDRQMHRRTSRLWPRRFTDVAGLFVGGGLVIH